MANRPLPARIVNPGVPWYVALPCNIIAPAAIVLLAIDPVENLGVALALLVPGAVALYGTALVTARKRRRDHG